IVLVACTRRQERRLVDSLLSFGDCLLSLKSDYRLRIRNDDGNRSRCSRTTARAACTLLKAVDRIGQPRVNLVVRLVLLLRLQRVLVTGAPRTCLIIRHGRGVLIVVRIEVRLAVRVEARFAVRVDARLML